ncbi:MAG TPA: RIP metalloprotease RseP, partial [Bryobacteraceae bacterium]|nr:RIP metalloprotease RseP [Bryobacteraceae bacterium]
EETVDDPRGFLAKPRWRRLIIAFAGPAMNIVLAVGLLTGMYMVRYPKMPPSAQEGIIGYVAPDSPAAKAGIKEGDKILKLDNLTNPNWEDIVLKEVASAGRTLNVKLQRGDKEFWTTVTPVLEDRTGLGSAGWQDLTEVLIAQVSPGMPADKAGLQPGDLLISANGLPLRSQFRLHEIIRAGAGKPVEIEVERNGERRMTSIQPAFSDRDGPGRWMIGVILQPRVVMTQLAFTDAFRESVRQNVKSATVIYQFLHGMVERRMSPKSLEGPIGIARLSGDAARQGALAFFGLMAMVSLNLAIFNLLPIPILDGGVIVMLLVEMLMRRDLSLRVKEAVFKLGFVFLMAVMVFVLYNDISKMFPG